MTHDQLAQTLLAACPNLPSIIIQDFVERMDPDYFRQCSMDQMHIHLRLASTLRPDQGCAIRIRNRKQNGYELTIVAYDYFAEFATFCGLLSAFGLNIREAAIFTYTDRPATQEPPLKRHAFWGRPQRKTPDASRPAGLSRKKVVDIFCVQTMANFEFGRRQQGQLKEELLCLIGLLGSNHIQEARRQVNRRLTETLGKIQKRSSTVIHPVHIQFNNTLSPNETIMDIQSTDTPAFLYAFSNALTMRGIYIAKATIDMEGTRVKNRLFVRGRYGRKITGKREQQALSTVVALIKEFTHFLTWAPDPTKALEHFDQFLDQLFEEQHGRVRLSVLSRKPFLGHLATLFGSSDFLWEECLRRQHANLLPVMETFQRGPLIRSKTALMKALHISLGAVKAPAIRRTRLNQFKDQELFRIDIRHLLDKTPLPDFSHALTNLAEAILQQALVEAQAKIDGRRSTLLHGQRRSYAFSLCGLGKLGGKELGYASDIEVLFIYETEGRTSEKEQARIGEYVERLAQELLHWIEAKQEGIFHIDTRLRPYGEKGILANSLAEIQRYYHPQGHAAPFERQALIKLRHLAGDAALGRKVEAHRDSFVYSQEPWPLDKALHLRERQINELIPPGSLHIKYSPGGLIDVEYTAQYLQLIHGHRIQRLRTPNTLQALERLQEEGILPMMEAQHLKEDYLFLRQLIDALRMVRGNAKDLLLPPPGSDAMLFLARRLGFITDDWQRGARALEKEITRRMTRTYRIFQKHFGPLPYKQKRTSTSYTSDSHVANSTHKCTTGLKWQV